MAKSSLSIIIMLRSTLEYLLRLPKLLQPTFKGILMYIYISNLTATGTLPKDEASVVPLFALSAF